MEVQLLIPGVQDCRESNLGTETLIAESKLEQSPGGSLKEQIEKEPAIEQSQSNHLMGEGDDQVEVASGQEPLGPLLEPFGLFQALALWTVAIAA
jgi:hypothetical protein